MQNLKPQYVSQVLALEKYLDDHDRLLAQSKAEYKLYTSDRIDELDFQTKLVKQALEAKKMWAAELATGLGKSILAARIAHERHHDGPAIYICPSAAALGDLQNGIINKFLRTFTHYKKRKNFTLGQLNDLSRANDVNFMTPLAFVNLLRSQRNRTIEMLRRASCLIVDEAHHFPQDLDNELQVYGDIFECADRYTKDGLTVAMTGTWNRLDRKAIMGREQPDARLTVQDAVDLQRCPEIYGVQIITDITAKKASYHGDLYDFHLSGAERKKYYRGIAECMTAVWRRYPVPFAAFARTRKDAGEIARLFNSLSGLGENGVAVLTGQTPLNRRKQIVNEILTRKRAGYITCAVGEEALDIPSLEVVHLIRRTKSIVRNGQSCGRAFRVCDGKKRALIIDYQTMLEGITDKFLGLNCEDIASNAWTRTERFVNGGPLVAQKSYPQGILTGMTMGEERALVCVRTMSSADLKKQELLRLARSGAPRPRSGNKRNTKVPPEESRLAKKLHNLTSLKSLARNEAFVAELRSVRPEWLEPKHKADDKKATLLKMAVDDLPKPKRNPKTKDAEHWLAIALFNYTHKSSAAFDEEFTAKINLARPDWFVRRRDESGVRKAELLKLASDNKPRPHWRSKLGKSLNRYTSPGSPLCDQELKLNLQTLRPDWFEATYHTKRLLLERAANGLKRPAFTSVDLNERRLAHVLRTYVKEDQKCYDAEFVEKLRAVNPTWLEIKKREWNRKGKQRGFAKVT